MTEEAKPKQTWKEWCDIKLFVEDNGVQSTSVQTVWSCNDSCFGELEKIAQNQEHYFAHYSSAPEGPHFKFAVRKVQTYYNFKKWCEQAKQAGKFKHFEFYDCTHDPSRDAWLQAKEVWDAARNLDKSEPLSLARALVKLPEVTKLNGNTFHPFCNMFGLTYGAEALFNQCLSFHGEPDWLLLPLSVKRMWDVGTKK